MEATEGGAIGPLRAGPTDPHHFGRRVGLGRRVGVGSGRPVPEFALAVVAPTIDLAGREESAVAALVAVAGQGGHARQRAGPTDPHRLGHQVTIPGQEA